MNKFHKILLVLIVSAAFSMMTGAEYGHTHNDGENHKECPVCVLTSAVHFSAVVPSGNIDCSARAADEFVLPEYTVYILKNYHSLYSPDRAPPAA